MDEVLCYVTGSGAQAQRYYPHYNHLYSPAALTDSTGTVVERYSYDAMGRQTITAGVGGAVRSKSAIGFDRTYTGYILDAESGLAYARSRMYSPTLGRFIGRDSRPTRRWNGGDGILRREGPASGDGYQDGMSLYCAYFVPSRTDPSGEGNCISGAVTGDASANAISMTPAEAAAFAKMSRKDQEDWFINKIKDRVGKACRIVAAQNECNKCDERFVLISIFYTPKGGQAGLHGIGRPGCDDPAHGGGRWQEENGPGVPGLVDRVDITSEAQGVDYLHKWGVDLHGADPAQTVDLKLCCKK